MHITLFSQRAILITVVASLWIGTAGTATASVLTFSGPTYSYVPQEYGDRIGSLGAPTDWSYGGTPDTPNVVVDYQPDSGSVNTWISGYGDLDNALGHDAFDVSTKLVFTPDDGFDVWLGRFEIAGWFGPFDTEIEISDSTNDVLWSWQGAVPYYEDDGSPTHITFSPQKWGVGAVTLSVNNIGSTGLDNIVFTQTGGDTTLSPVPIPAAAWLFGSALFGLVFARGHRQRAPICCH